VVRRHACAGQNPHNRNCARNHASGGHLLGTLLLLIVIVVIVVVVVVNVVVIVVVVVDGLRLRALRLRDDLSGDGHLHRE
jgi:predicted metalloprotease